MGKKHYDFSLPEETMRGFKVFIVNIQEGQFKKGDLSKWLNIFINNGIQGHNTHAHNTQNTNPYQIPIGRLKVKNMMQNICKQHLLDISEIPLVRGKTILTKHLKQLIQDVTGHHDYRTIDKHMKDLIKYEYIKDSGHIGTFLVLDTGTDLEHIEKVLEKQNQDERNKKQQEEKQAKKEFDTVIEDLK